jgi:hypothetical protein
LRPMPPVQVCFVRMKWVEQFETEWAGADHLDTLLNWSSQCESVGDM